MTKVKICGLKELEHIKVAVEAKADFLGFVFAPSKRKISIETAKTLAKQVPPTVKKVGVFVNATKEFILNVQEEVGLDYIQYHGDESPSFIEEVGLPAIKAFSMNESVTEENLLAYSVDYYLLDAPGIQHRGGSGKTFNWALIKNLNIPSSKIILAGGLNRKNVADAIQFVQPFAVDVSSGVEYDGRKDAKLINQFIEAAKEVTNHV